MNDEQNTKPEAATDPQGRLDALVRAFSVTCNGFSEGIYFCSTAGKAKAAALAQARNAGYALNFADLRVKRAPEFDGATYCGKTPTTGVIPEYLDVP